MALALASFPKVDGHIHFNAARENILSLADTYNFSFITVNTEVPSFPSINRQQEIACNFPRETDSTLRYISTISTEHIEEPGWADETIKQINQNIERGALGVKFWKNIGMSIQYEDDSYLMLDDQKLRPVFNYLEEQGIPVLGHQGEPKNCWLPLEEMTVKSDRDYFAAHPEYHMHKQEEYPGYWDHINARDAVLARHPSLTFVGAHIGSLEWSLDKVAERFDRYPNFGIDLAERFAHLYYHAAKDRQKVIDFFKKYQNRIIYGTDIIDEPDVKPSDINQELENRWNEHWRFLSTDDQISSKHVATHFKGLALPEDIIAKVYRLNALEWYGISDIYN